MRPMLGINLDPITVRTLRTETSTTTFSLAMNTNDTVTANVIHDRLLKAIDNLGDKVEIDLKVTSTSTTKLSNSPF